MRPEQLQDVVRTAVAPGFRGQLLAKGQARSMIWQDGVLPSPPDAPRFPKHLTYNLESYAYSLLGIAIRLREQKKDEDLTRTAFEQSANALEAVVSNGNPEDPSRGFHRLLAAAAFHLGRYSARAYSLLAESLNAANLSRIERALALFILRDFDRLDEEIVVYLTETASDDRLVTSLVESLDQSAERESESSVDEASMGAVNIALTAGFMRGIGAYLCALESGAAELVDVARQELRRGLAICEELNLVPQWWSFKLTIHLLDDLWSVSFHVVLPVDPPDGAATQWVNLRALFITSLGRRKRGEVELWPSQLAAARRATNVHDDLVVSLPTSAGKTRIAELCILRTLAEGKRVVFVTPLRALSAQTETNLYRTFGPLGITISALYGSMGTSRFEEDAIKARHIVVATPEKLDFALRNDASLIDDVGLIVLDEGHMIGLGEREVRYEAQIQRLLKRTDSNRRRIVCLSAILPSGQEFEDFVSWLRHDQPGSGVTCDWRPTRLRFGEVLWTGNYARLQLRVGEERPFVPRFLTAAKPPKGQRKKLFPKDQRELVLATAWRLVEDGQSVLIYCPERRSVEPFAKAIVDLHERGALTSLLTVGELLLETALSIGQEWLGAAHPILACLRLGVAIHHGALPTPFRKEMERLLRDGVLKVTVSSPTLAQGLNLAATALVLYSLSREGETIPASEFKNVSGRAGRAFIDVEGLILYPMFDDHSSRQVQWQQLITDTKTLSMQSGLLRLVLWLLERLYAALKKPPIDQLLEYVMNNAAAWRFPEIPGEGASERGRLLRNWNQYVATLDTAILSLLGDDDPAADQLARRLDEVLESSLWARNISRMKSEKTRGLADAALKARARLIWSSSDGKQRRGYFLAGVGLETGKRLDAVAHEANALLLDANGAISSGENARAVAAISALAEKLFDIPPFVPEPCPVNWREILALWLAGAPIANVGGSADISDVLRFVENGLVYKLPWGMDAIRVRAEANEDDMGLGTTIDSYEVGWAVPAVETGTLNRSAALLIQAGFTSRLAAIKAAEDTSAAFLNTEDLTEWLQSEEVVSLSQRAEWPTRETAGLWRSFLDSYTPSRRSVWSKRSAVRHVRWRHGVTPPPAGSIVRIRNLHSETVVMSPTYDVMGTFAVPIRRTWAGVLLARVGVESGTVNATYYGPKDIRLN